MPSITDDDTVKEIARVFCGEGKRNKTETLRIVGYSKAYCEHGHSSSVLWGNAGVIAAIEAESARVAAVSEYNREKATELLMEGLADCSTCDRTNRLGNIKELNTIHGLHKIDSAPTVVIDQRLIGEVERKHILHNELKLLDDINSAPLAIPDE